ncbi:hypothetical protein E2562_010160 [Oryza meyeriana var. granulata]|uniref:Uncharacterized protein n=1 Tax=Oryza meyeriana var. granulata TaxID=110450 RepID=A0A6G1EKM8_9ORYZ|nr:hypothetical protein E2562_010160 [Oryza meyeriana var. granulata]
MPSNWRDGAIEKTTTAGLVRLGPNGWLQGRGAGCSEKALVVRPRGMARWQICRRRAIPVTPHVVLRERLTSSYDVATSAYDSIPRAS